MRVAFLAPAIQGKVRFYDIFGDLMRAAARQLDIELEILDGTSERAIILERGRELASRATAPDYVIFVNQRGIATELLPRFAERGLRSVLVAEGLSAGERAELGRQARSTLLGEMAPDDLETGYVLANELVAEAQRRGLAGEDRKVQVGVVAGMQTQWSSLRFRGWQRFREARPDVVQAGFQYGTFDGESGKAAAALLLRADPQIRVLWCANDEMALGAAQAVAEVHRKAGEDVLIGGVDLLDEALAAILKGTMYVSLGGHIIDGVRALLLLDEHHHGHGLEGRNPKPHLEVVKADEAGHYLEFLKKRAWRDVDFTRFSAHRNPSGSVPELSLHALAVG